jgi:hypothetical protein
MTEACERRILEFPVGMDARELARELKREGWYAWAAEYQSIILRIERVRAKAGNCGILAGYSKLAMRSQSGRQSSSSRPTNRAF